MVGGGALSAASQAPSSDAAALDYEELRRVPTHLLIKHGPRGPSNRIVASHENVVIIKKSVMHLS